MSVDAAALVAQVVVGLIIAMILEGQRFVATMTRQPELIQPIDMDGRLEVLSRRGPAVITYLILFLISGLLSAVSLSLCLNGVISDSAITSAGTKIVTTSLVLQMFFVVIVPTVAITIRLWRRLGLPAPWPGAFAVVAAVTALSAVGALLVILTSP